MLVTRWEFTRYSLLVVKSLVARCKIHSLLVVEVTRCKKSLVTRCRSCSLQKNYLLLVPKFTRYLLQKFLVAQNHSFVVAKFTCYSLQKLLVAKNHSLLVATFAFYSSQKITRYSLQKIINHSLKHHTSIKTGKNFFNIIFFLKPKNSKLFQVNILSWNLWLPEHFPVQQYTIR